MNATEEESELRLRNLQESVDSNPNDSSSHFDLGVYLWENGGDSKELKEKSAEQFVLSAKLNPENAAAFRYLGHYYSRVCSDTQRAAKCYQRAVSLDPNDSDSGESLCNLLDRGGNESLEFVVCRDASQKSPRAFWAFRRLGYLQVHQKKWSESVQNLQHAIRGYPTSDDLWEALGLAYHRLGMYTAAIKAYSRAIELDDTRIFSLIESGNIFLMLGSYRKGVENCKQALKISPQNVAALYSLASGLLSWSKECIDLGGFRWAASLLEDACKVAEAASDLAGNMSSIWKLHGDTQITYARCFPWMEEIEDLKFDAESFSSSVLSWRKTCYSAVVSAKKSYQRALRLAPWEANLYTDVAIASDFISYLNEYADDTPNAWQLPEKMTLGALMLEGDNCDFWVALGCLSRRSALKQHAFIRGLQLDVSLAIAWAYLGQLYRDEGDHKLAKQAFDRARSIDPSLALPWAGSADSYAREATTDEAFESCLRAVQIKPLAEFQVGLAKLALESGNLSSPQVLGAIKQAVQRAPYYPETHNLHGLVCEARLNYHGAVASYRLALSTVKYSLDTVPKSHYRDISINLARSLSKAGNALEAVQECKVLKEKGMLDAQGFQIYALSLWQIGEKELALSVTRDLAASVSTMEQRSAATSISFICRLLYYISGLDSAINSILKMPKEFFQSSNISFVVAAIHSLDQGDRLQKAVSTSREYLKSHEEITGMHYLIALGKLLKQGHEHSLGYQKGVAHLRKFLHVYPNSDLLRDLLGYLLLSSEESKESPVSSRCCVLNAYKIKNKEGLASAWEVLGGGAVSCYAIGNGNPKFSFPTCSCQCQKDPVFIQKLQKCLRQEPWNHCVRYILILNLFQKAREERFPRQLCSIIERLITVALSDENYTGKDLSFQYNKFQLLLCASEITLRRGSIAASIRHAEHASALCLPDNYIFFGHLQLCRAFAADGNKENLQSEYKKCLELNTSYFVGWLCLKLIEFQYQVQTDSNTLELRLLECLKEIKNSRDAWMAVYSLVLGLKSLSERDLYSAEKSLAQACSLAGSESCHFLCHGIICMELARQFADPQFLPVAIRSLHQVQNNSLVPLPAVSLLLGQLEGSLGSKDNWEKHLRLEWFSWPPDMRPAEIYFQMHLLAEQMKDRSESTSVESWQSSEKWVLRAIHTNPSCLRYWKVLPKLAC